MNTTNHGACMTDKNSNMATERKRISRCCFVKCLMLQDEEGLQTKKHTCRQTVWVCELCICILFITKILKSNEII